MMNRLLLNLIKYLSRKNLSLEDSLALSNLVLDKIGAIPFSDIITYDEEGRLVVGGKTITVEQAKILKEAANSALRNKALELVQEHTAFAAVAMGVHKAKSPAQMFFARAGLWLIAQEKKALSDLAQDKNINLVER